MLSNQYCNWRLTRKIIRATGLNCDDNPEHIHPAACKFLSRHGLPRNVPDNEGEQCAD